MNSNYARIGFCPIHQCKNCSEVFNPENLIKKMEARLKANESMVKLEKKDYWISAVDEDKRILEILRSEL